MRKVLLLLSVLATGCAQTQFIPFTRQADGTPKVYPPTLPESVGIYRSTVPLAKFTELGLISLRSQSPNLSVYYSYIRDAAAKHGAQAVVGVKFTHETHEESHMEQQCTSHVDCDANGSCNTVQDCNWVDVTSDVTTYLFTGSMIREAP